MDAPKRALLVRQFADSCMTFQSRKAKVAAQDQTAMSQYLEGLGLLDHADVSLDARLTSKKKCRQ